MSLNEYKVDRFRIICLLFTVQWFQVLNQVADMTLRFNNLKPVSLFANSDSWNLISENKDMSNQHRYAEQGNHHDKTKPTPWYLKCPGKNCSKHNDNKDLHGTNKSMDIILKFLHIFCLKIEIGLSL